MIRTIKHVVSCSFNFRSERVIFIQLLITLRENQHGSNINNLEDVFAKKEAKSKDFPVSVWVFSFGGCPFCRFSLSCSTSPGDCGLAPSHFPSGAKGMTFAELWRFAMFFFFFRKQMKSFDKTKSLTMGTNHGTLKIFEKHETVIFVGFDGSGSTCQSFDFFQNTSWIGVKKLNHAQQKMQNVQSGKG